MDKNQAIGLTSIIAILIGYSWYTMPSEEEIAAQKAERDSIEAVEAERASVLQEQKAVEKAREVETTIVYESDSAKNDALTRKYGEFGVSGEGEEGLVYIENDVLRIGLSKKGGHPASVQLKRYQKYTGGVFSV